MNFRHLNEAFNRLNEKALNEGPGAGYTIKGTTTIIKVDNVKVLSKEDNEYDSTYEVSFNGRGTADIEFASYYYGGSLEDVPVVATKAYVDVDTNDINNGYTVEQYIESLFYNEELKIDLIYGGGWLHSTYDGTVASEEYPAENTYADIVITDMKITDEDIIQYIDAVVQGEFENDDYFEESLKESEDITYTPKVRRFKSVDGTNRIINQYYEEPDYPNWGKGERNKKEISDDEYNRFLQTGKLKEDASKEWKPNTSFAHIKKIYNDVKKRGYKYVNNELEEMHAAMKKVDAKGYTPEQRKQIRSWSEEIWRATRKNESLNEEESAKSISDNDNSYPLAFVPTTDVKGKDLTNTLCDVLNKAGIKNCCAKKRGGKYHITVICPSTELGTAKTIIENCGFFKEWLPLNRG